MFTFILASLVVAITLSYAVLAFFMSRRKRSWNYHSPKDLFFVILVPCLNEEVVISKTIKRLLSLPNKNFAVLVIDDGSEDNTAQIVQSFEEENIWLLQRKFPNARKGKGQALNHAFRYLRDSGVLGNRNHEDVIVGVFDADGRISPNALYEISREFEDPKVGGAQIGVRMYNMNQGLLARLQDMEFVIFTEIFQKFRQNVGSVGLGGNGQFNRLTALKTLGDDPWTDCLTEDLDLGIRLKLNGWTNSFCPTSHVSQQAVLDVKRLVRQRARWFQGHMQCWSLVPKILKGNLRLLETQDLLYHLMSPLVLLVMSVPSAVFIGVTLVSILLNPLGFLETMFANNGQLALTWYALAFGLAPIYAFVYWLLDNKTPFWKSVLYSHAFIAYGYLWFAIGWLAVYKSLRRSSSWAKTTRTADNLAEAA